MEVEIKGRPPLVIQNLLLDFNGTLAQAGKISEPAKQLLHQLPEELGVFVATADTRGNAAAECEGLPVELLELPQGMPEDKGKLQLIEKLGKEKTVAFGNGRNDALILSQSALGICVLGEEGANKMAVAAAQILVRSVEDGLKLLTEPVRLIAALRN